jgi:hypothetical protein
VKLRRNLLARILAGGFILPMRAQLRIVRSAQGEAKCDFMEKPRLSQGQVQALEPE